MNLQVVYLIMSIMLTCQFGLAHTYVTLSLNDALQGVRSCAVSLQVSQDYELMNEEFFNVFIKPENYEAIQRALDTGANPNAFVIKTIESTDDRSIRRFLRSKTRSDSIADFRSSVDLEALEEVTGRFIDVLIDGTALHLAVTMGDPYLVNLLLESKARMDIRNVSGLTPFSLLAYQKVIDSRDMDLMVHFFITSHPIESDITDAFKEAATQRNFPMIEAIAKYARRSEVIRKLKNGHLIFSRINYMLGSIGLSTNQSRKKKGYYLAFKHLQERGLL